MKIAVKNTWACRQLKVVAIAFVLAMACGTGFNVEAAATIYNMDHLLNEPHPFARPQAKTPAPATIQQTPSKTRVETPAETPAETPVETPDAENDSDDDLDLDDLGPSPGEAEKAVNDPIEPFNRAMFGFNEVLIKYLIGPFARGYNAVLPGVARDAIRSFLSNLNGPVVLANDLLQGEFKRGYDTTMRMVINSTVGVLGFIDVAEKVGFAKHGEDFGQTLAVWGVGEGFYLVLPIFGPSNPRDALGKYLVDPYFDPLGYYLDNIDKEEIGYGITAARGLTGYAAVVDQIDDLRENSLDFYGALRSLYRQRRQAEIKNGRGDSLPQLPPMMEE